MNNPRFLETHKITLPFAIKTFQKLAKLIGNQKVIWRYDPIIFTQDIDIDFHLQQYTNIANQLSGYTKRCVISFMDRYTKNKSRLQKIEQDKGIKFSNFLDMPEVLTRFLPSITQIAHQCNIEVFSCAESYDLQPYGIHHGKCIDDDYIRKVFQIEVNPQKDSGQREACGCVKSRDIGMYDSCLFGCQYCYATSNFEKARDNYQKHHPNSPSLVGCYDLEQQPKQLELF